MKIGKTVTKRKLAANRRNAKLSTGPRTERGKSIVRFNATKLGLSAKHVVIPCLEGESELFPGLLASLIEEYSPVGPTESRLVLVLAESLMRMDRVTRAEKATALLQTRRDTEALNPFEVETAARVLLEILTNAQEEIDSTGTLSTAAYDLTLRSMMRVCPRFTYHRILEHQEKLLSEVRIDDEFLA
jgi:hypothetical protein